MNYSGFWRRFFAAIIDGAILSIPGFVFSGTTHHFGIGFGLHLFFGFLYYPFFESSIMSATPGKALMGMLVLTETEERISFKSAVIRYFGRYLSMLTCYIGYIMQVFTARRQTLHDMISKTIVVDKESTDINYFTAWKDQFKEVVNKL